MKRFGARQGLWVLLVTAMMTLPVDLLADDPLDDMNGTEGWDQVVQPRQKTPQRNLMAEKEAFRREVADWEAVRQLWQFEREAYIAEKTHHRNLTKKMNRRRRAGANASDGDDLYEDEWGDQPGQNWFDSASSIDRAIDDELDDGSPIQTESSSGLGSTGSQPIYSPIPEPDPEEFRKRKKAEEKARKLRKAEERRRREEEEQRAREEEERRRKEQEAAAGAAAAEALMKQQEEEIRREQEAIRKKAGVEMDKEGQVVDPELKKEISEDGDEEEEED
jgi:hypothetical protein